MMKKYISIFLTICGVALALASCKKLNEIPKFEASESFAALLTSSFGIDEDKGELHIPVQIASIDPVQTMVSYKITDGTAKVGVDYEDTNEDAVLTFDGKTRQQDIVIKIINRAGEYTGDLDFSLELISATGLKLTLEKAAKITIYDLDHPLSSILGTYEGSAEDVGGHVDWTLHLTKDPKDVTIVWCDGICPMAASNARTFAPVYANVTKDDETGLYTLSFPVGQVVAADYNGNGQLELYETYIDGDYYIDDASPITFTQTATGFESLFGMGLVNDYLYYNAFLLGDRTTPGQKVVWTKQ